MHSPFTTHGMGVLSFVFICATSRIHVICIGSGSCAGSKHIPAGGLIETRYPTPTLDIQASIHDLSSDHHLYLIPSGHLGTISYSQQKWHGTGVEGPRCAHGPARHTSIKLVPLPKEPVIGLIPPVYRPTEGSREGGRNILEQRSWTGKVGAASTPLGLG